MRKFFVFFTLLLIVTCEGSGGSNICNPDWFFREQDKNLVDFEEVSLNIFDPYCSSCHSTQAYLNNQTGRDNYLPLDSEMKNLRSDQIFLNLLREHINFSRPETSILYRVLNEADVRSFDGTDFIRSIEPRNNCFLPNDFKNAIIWWIENADGNIQNLLN